MQIDWILFVDFALTLVVFSCDGKNSDFAFTKSSRFAPYEVIAHNLEF
jgi:hypothetical protein